VLQRALGDEAFAALGAAYVDACPSSRPSIRWYGDRLAEFMRTREDLVPHPALVDLARMDWALRGAFDAGDAAAIGPAALNGLPAEAFAALQKGNTNRADANAFWQIQARNLAKMNSLNAHIVVGTDGNTPYAPHFEMEDMVAAGMTPAQVIRAATSNGAQFLRMTDTGTIEANKSADFIVLDANPLDNITNTRKISSVYLRGASVDRSSYK